MRKKGKILQEIMTMTQMGERETVITITLTPKEPLGNQKQQAMKQVIMIMKRKEKQLRKTLLMRKIKRLVLKSHRKEMKYQLKEKYHQN